MARGKLTAVSVARQATPGRYGDGGGLWLQVARAGTKSWLFRYSRDGRAREMGLGSTALITLAEARDLALDARRVLLKGKDPIEARDALQRAAKIEAAKAITFAEAAERYIGSHEESWRNEKHRAQWRSTIDAYANKEFGTVPVGVGDTAMVVKVLEPLWTKKPETAGRLRGRLEAVLDWATVREYRSGENPARWRGHLSKLLPPRDRLAKVRHHPALPYREVPHFMARLRDCTFVSGRALEFTILTAARTGEAIGARWAEIDLDARVWTVPAERTKSGRVHRVPLSDRAIAVLQATPCEPPRLGTASGFVFVGARRGEPLSNMAMLELVRGMRKGITVHGFRSSFRDWAAEQTEYANEVCEAALAHVVGDRVEAAYRRGDLFEKRAQLMAAWADYCAASQDSSHGT